MYALINTFHKMPNAEGSIESMHRSREAAEKANAKLQKDIKRSNGRHSYMPCIVRKVISAKWKRNQPVWASDIVDES
jgi:hypothetical protein